MAKRDFDNLNVTKEVKKKVPKNKAQKELDKFFDPKVKIKKDKKTFSIDEKVVAELRMFAAANDETLSHVVEKALKEYIDKNHIKQSGM
jgi:hypothetical protein